MSLAQQQRAQGYGPVAPVPIYQWESEFSALLEIYRERQPKSVLEIGTYHGGTLYHWLQNASPGAVVTSLDSYAVGVDNRHLYPEWAKEGNQLHVLQGDSHKPETVAAVAEYAPFDWIFIDAGHFLSEVRGDWELYRPLAALGGMVVFHDILPPSKEHPEIEVSYLWEEIKAAYKTGEIIGDPHATWGGLGLVYL